MDKTLELDLPGEGDHYNDAQILTNCRVGEVLTYTEATTLSSAFSWSAAAKTYAYFTHPHLMSLYRREKLFTERDLDILMDIYRDELGRNPKVEDFV